ncbi:hypothetical protein [Kamptonema formosum]|uniref:hypothetical protein n=1 Tax=Kamptonema formosum TaxID=331992 RepID=UPI000349E096|nr:hypothetical protein [Oscillatoria sp. PCC 10802]
MKELLTDYINPRYLTIVMDDIANGTGKSAHTLSFPKQKPKHEKPEDAWKWDYIFLIVVEGEGGLFCSYRILRCWLESVIHLLAKCGEWAELEKLIKLTEMDIETHAYTDANKQALRAVLQKQKVRLQQLKAKAITFEKALERAKWWVFLFKSCMSKRYWNLANKLKDVHKGYFDHYPELLEWVEQVALEQLEWLRQSKSRSRKRWQVQDRCRRGLAQL